MNKNIIKNTFDKKINKDDIYNNVLKKVTKKNFNYLRLGIIPVTIVILICFISLNYKKVENIKEGIDIIHINNIDNETDSLYDIIWNGFSVTKEELGLRFNWFNKLVNTDLDYSNYIKLTDIKETYLMILAYDNINLEIFISEIGEKKPRCITFLDEKHISKSIINNQKVEIYKSKNTYIAFFELDGFNYDIELTNATQDEFIKLIKLILQ